MLVCMYVYIYIYIERERESERMKDDVKLWDWVHSYTCDLLHCPYSHSSWWCRLQRALTSRRGHQALTTFAGSSTACIACTTILTSMSGCVRVLVRSSAPSALPLGKAWMNVDGQVWLQFCQISRASNQSHKLDLAAILAVVMSCRLKNWWGKTIWHFIDLCN